MRFLPFLKSVDSLVPKIALAASTLAFLSTSACHRERGMNILLVTIDTLRADHCSTYGYARETTPTLQGLSEQGARMALAYAPTATTGPTHASIMTSLYPLTHGVVKNGMTLDDRFETLAERLRAAGYRTEAVVSSFVLDAKFGYAQGFEAYDDDFDAAHATVHRTEFDGHEVEGAFDQTAPRTTEKAGRVLARLAAGREPFFLFVHYFDPHAPYVPPFDVGDRFAAADARDELARSIGAYDGEIAFADRELSGLLDSLARSGLERETLVVVTADHGEGLMQHGHMHHGVQIYEEAVRVPLLFRLPGRIAAGRTFVEPVELIDLLPTVFELAGIRFPGPAQGRSLAPALAGGAPLDPQREVYLHRRHYAPGEVGGIRVAGEQFGIRSGRWKYIEGDEEGTRELYDLDHDPGERVNLVESAPQTADAMRALVAAWKDAHRRDTAEPLELSPEDLERLKALGYVD